jgi:large subunit ribosomal protein L25
MEKFVLEGTPRSGLGKGASRRLRSSGQVPAVLYGAGEAPEALQLSANSVKRQLEHEAFFSHVLTIRVDGRETQAVLKAMQRDPTTDFVIHLDLLRVDATHEITMRVPLHFIHEERCPGRKAGGVVSRLMVDLEVVCLPQHLPEYIEVELGGLEIGDSVHLSQLVLPTGVTLANPVEDEEHDQPVVSCTAPSRLEAEEGEEEEAPTAEVPLVSGEDREED